MKNFWTKLEKPFFCLAPMSDVTDIAFRRILAKYGKDRGNKNKIVFWTEFVAADGLANKLGRKKLAHILKYSESERPIVAQVFGANPENMKIACQYIASLDFDGIDINMGCPDQSVISQGAGAALIRTPELAKKIIESARDGIKSAGKDIPVSVKTRIGFNTEEIYPVRGREGSQRVFTSNGVDSWISFLLKQNLSALTVHLRTKKEMSEAKAHWELMPQIISLRNKIAPQTLIIGNGDVENLEEAKEKAKKCGCDGVMIGRAIFGNPWLFANLACEKRNCQIEHPVLNLPINTENNNDKKITKKFIAAQSRNSAERSECDAVDKFSKFKTGIAIEDRLKVLIEHTKLFEKLLGKHKSFAVMKKHFKAYVNGFDGAKELRMKLMETKNSKEVEKIIKEFLKNKKQPLSIKN